MQGSTAVDFQGPLPALIGLAARRSKASSDYGAKKGTGHWTAQRSPSTPGWAEPERAGPNRHHLDPATTAPGTPRREFVALAAAGSDIGLAAQAREDVVHG
mmetsp:Transcript_10580/g.30251  ORF Transcript_10580/g.30251 Transcript_10580/m.30251 type:complete len:101 (+) Transcript_10580:336-638(+)